MKKNSILIISTSIIIILLLTIFLKTENKTKQEESTFDRIMKEDKIKLCYVSWPPSVIKDSNTGEVSGMLIDIAEEIARQAEIEIEYVESTWGEFPADLNTGRCDAGIAGIYPTITRSTSVSFTRPFFYVGNSVGVKKKDERFEKIEDLNKENVKIAVLQGAFEHTFAEKFLPKAQLVVLDKNADLSMTLVAVSSGQADAGLAPKETVVKYIKEQEKIKDLFPEKPYSTSPIAWAIRNQDHKLLKFLDNSIDYLRADGFIENKAKEYAPIGWYIEKAEYLEIVKEK
jgi:cyclohexadienyl dehydratase